MLPIGSKVIDHSAILTRVSEWDELKDRADPENNDR